MKIIGTSGPDCYLVEVSRYELGMIEDDIHGRFAGRKDIAPGTKLAVGDAYRYISILRNRRAEALKGAAFLRAFADHLEAEVPRLVPAEPPASDGALEAQAEIAEAASARLRAQNLRQWLHRIEEVAGRAASTGRAEEFARIEMAARDARADKAAPLGFCETRSPDDEEGDAS